MIQSTNLPGMLVVAMNSNVHVMMMTRHVVHHAIENPWDIHVREDLFAFFYG